MSLSADSLDSHFNSSSADDSVSLSRYHSPDSSRSPVNTSTSSSSATHDDQEGEEAIRIDTTSDEEAEAAVAVAAIRARAIQHLHLRIVDPGPRRVDNSSSSSANSTTTATTDEGEEEEEEEEQSSSDVEIYLSSLGIDDSFSSFSRGQPAEIFLAQSQPLGSGALPPSSQSHPTNNTNTNADPADDLQFLTSHTHTNARRPYQDQRASPTLPPAPTHAPIPLPLISACASPVPNTHQNRRNNEFSSNSALFDFDFDASAKSNLSGNTHGSGNASNPEKFAAAANVNVKAPPLARPTYTFQATPSSGSVATLRGSLDFASASTNSASTLPSAPPPTSASPNTSTSASSPAPITAIPSAPVSSNADIHSTSPASTSTEFKTANVYINGLPPHFPEERLFALASPFGPVRSVRTFTRHVRESESGYGFVLFENVEDAEKCIVSLRKYRNLHPTFSKQAHKIPGTSTSLVHSNGLPPSSSISMSALSPTTPVHDKATLVLPPPLVGPHALPAPQARLVCAQSEGSEDGFFVGSGGGGGGSGGWQRDGGAFEEGSASFKAKMEALHDRNSTNLYMEGLPLNIDEPTLAALVSPHRISSSRFFQTRLSNPPRIIAFVRFETRAGAEEIIERLHGRMVRGWNDVGSRISVRFADTAEQRELRRNERMAREGDESPARLTIAQAALLNLHGQDLRSKHTVPPQVPALRIPTPQQVFPDYAHNHNDNHTHNPAARTHTPPFVVDYSLAGRRPPPLQNAYSHSHPHRHSHPHSHPHSHSHSHSSRTHTPVHTHPHAHHQHHQHSSYDPPPMDPAMSALLESLRGHATSYQDTLPLPLPSPSHLYSSAHNPHAHNHVHDGFASNRPESSYDAPYEYEYDVYGSAGLRGHHAHGQGQGQGQRASNVQQARSGYTATEEFIMRAHADSQQQRRRGPPPPLDLRRRDSEASLGAGAMGGVGMRAHRSQGQGQPQFSPSLGVGMPLVGEEEFHKTGGGAVAGAGDGRIIPAGSGVKHNHRIHPAHVNARLGRAGGEVESSPQPQQSPNLGPGIQSFQHAHLRSSTLPHRVAPAAAPPTRHFQHNSMSVSGTNHLQSQNPNQNQSQNQNQNLSQGQNVMYSSNTNKNSNSTSDATGIIYDRDVLLSPSSNGTTNNVNNNNKTNGNNNNSSNIGIHYENSHQQQQEHAPRYHHPNHHRHHRNQSQSQSQQGHDHDHQHHNRTQSHNNHHHTQTLSPPGTYDTDPSSPSLISPALTYSSQHSRDTPSTLSPATPFFSSFGGAQDGFAGGGNGHAAANTLKQQQHNVQTQVQSAFEGKNLRAGSH
ncbi:hypothetical protein DXG03_001654 [Asterophora parasitica]|uniref:RRM domain-containing protein n=1 Tax=Asterophora parasitica TaxID=117018 RepID=A0A9P7G9B3_9AGAR|nr:hypothetical protein DXG03_001654 [Asterophora parasitica]